MVPRSTSWTVTFAPGTTPPPLSRTTPTMFPVSFCACALLQQNMKAISKANSRLLADARVGEHANLVESQGLERLERELIAQLNSMIVVGCQLILSKMIVSVLLRFNLTQIVAQSAGFNPRQRRSSPVSLLAEERRGRIREILSRER